MAHTNLKIQLHHDRCMAELLAVDFEAGAAVTSPAQALVNLWDDTLGRPVVQDPKGGQCPESVA